MLIELPRLAASYYSNSAPLIWSFWRGAKRAEVNLITDAAPSNCAEMLRSGAVEIALTPVIEYQRIANTVIVPGVCVSSQRAVRSVVLVTRGGELKNVKTLALDVSSRTSAALAEIIFRETYGFAPEFIPHAPDIAAMLRKADAALLIGDPALNLDRREFRVFDIVELWRELTGLGFVFAFWLARESAIAEAAKIDFVGARDEGLREIETIIDFYSPAVPLARDDFRRYLTENINYSLGAEMLEGLRLYYKLAHKNGIIKETKPLRFV